LEKMLANLGEIWIKVIKIVANLIRFGPKMVGLQATKRKIKKIIILEMKQKQKLCL